MDGQPTPLLVPPTLSVDTATSPVSGMASPGSRASSTSTSASAPRFKVKLRLGGRPRSADGPGSDPAAGPAVPMPDGGSAQPFPSFPSQHLHHQNHSRNATNLAGGNSQLTQAANGSALLALVPSDPLQASGATAQAESNDRTTVERDPALVSSSDAATTPYAPPPSKKRKSTSASSTARKMPKLDQSVLTTTSAASEIAERPSTAANVNASGQATPSESRQGTPLPGRSQSAAAHDHVFKDKNSRPRKWKRGPVSVLTIGGGEMVISLWSSDQLPTFPPRKQQAANSDAQVEMASSLAGEVPGTPPTATSLAAATADPQSSSAPSPKPIPMFDPSRPHVCPYGDSLGCVRAFPTKGKLAMHILTVHGPKTHACEVCPKKFASITQLVRHRKTHENPAGRLSVGQGHQQQQHLQ